MTDKLREAAQMALEALEWITAQRTGGLIQRKANEPITALRSALSDLEQEPVVWWHRESDTFTSGYLVNCFSEWVPLYATPHPAKHPIQGEGETE